MIPEPVNLIYSAVVIEVWLNKYTKYWINSLFTPIPGFQLLLQARLVFLEISIWHLGEVKGTHFNYSTRSNITIWTQLPLNVVRPRRVSPLAPTFFYSSPVSEGVSYLGSVSYPKILSAFCPSNWVGRGGCIMWDSPVNMNKFLWARFWWVTLS